MRSMRHLKLYEEYSDEELNALRSFGHEYDVIKRRVESSDLEIESPFDAKSELDFIEDWTGPFGEKIQEVSGFIEDISTELDISFIRGSSQPLKYDHIRFDAKYPISIAREGVAKLTLFPAGIMKGDPIDVSDRFSDRYLGQYQTYLQSVLELYSDLVKYK